MNEETKSPPKKDGGAVFWAFFLIFIGVVFLLNNSGALAGDTWIIFWQVIWRFWPVFLIMAGLQIIFGNRLLFNIFSALVFFLIIFGTLAFSIVVGGSDSNLKDSLKTNFPFLIGFKDSIGFLTEEDKIKEEISLDKDKYKDVESRDIKMKLVAGEYNFFDSANDEYFKVNAQYYEGRGEPVIKEDLNGKNLSVDFQTEFQPSLNVSGNVLYDFELGQKDLSTDMELEITAGDGKLELDQISIDTFKLRMTAGDFESRFTKDATPKEIEINLTAGSYKLILPKDIGANIQYRISAGDIKVDGSKLRGNDDLYLYNPSASKLIDISLNISAGDIEIDFE